MPRPDDDHDDDHDHDLSALGLRIGHWTDPQRGTGLTVFLPPADATVAAQLWGQNAGTVNVEGHGPYGLADQADAIVLTGGSSFGIPAIAGLIPGLSERGVGHEVAGRRLPLVAGAVIFDLMVGTAEPPDPDAALRAVDAALPAGTEARGTVGAATGATVGDVDGLVSAVKGGFGRAWRRTAQGPLIAAWAVVNAFGDVLDEHGEVLAGMRRNGRFARAAEVLASDPDPLLVWGRATTLVVAATDARLTKPDLIRLSHAAAAGMASTTSPSGTGLDGDTIFALSTGTVEPKSILGLEAVTASVVAAAIRDGVRTATGLHGVPAIADL